MWSGDVDLNNGGLQKQYDDYIKRIDQAKKLGIQNTFMITYRSMFYRVEQSQHSLFGEAIIR